MSPLSSSSAVSQSQPIRGKFQSQLEEWLAHLQAGLDARDLEYLAVNPDRRPPTMVKVGGYSVSID